MGYSQTEKSQPLASGIEKCGDLRPLVGECEPKTLCLKDSAMQCLQLFELFMAIIFENIR